MFRTCTHSSNTFSAPILLINDRFDMRSACHNELYMRDEIDKIFSGLPGFMKEKESFPYISDTDIKWYSCDEIPGLWAYFYPEVSGYAIYLSCPIEFDSNNVPVKWEVTGDNSRYHVMGWIEQIKQIAEKLGIYKSEPLELPDDDDEIDDIEVNELLDTCVNPIESKLKSVDVSKLDKTVRIWWKHTDSCDDDGGIMVKSFINGWLYANMPDDIHIEDRDVYHWNTNDDIHMQYMVVSYSSESSKTFYMMMHALYEFINNCGTEVILYNITEGEELPTNEYSECKFDYVSGCDVQKNIEDMSSL